LIVVDASVLTDFLLGRSEALDAVQRELADAGLAMTARRWLGEDAVGHVP
jgi:hypothetical protein